RRRRRCIPGRSEAQMTRPWLVVVLVGAATMAIKAAGPVLLGGREPPARLLPVLRLLAPALFAALVVSQAFAGGRTLTLDARAGRRPADRDARVQPFASGGPQERDRLALAPGARRGPLREARRHPRRIERPLGHPPRAERAAPGPLRDRIGRAAEPDPLRAKR